MKALHHVIRRLQRAHNRLFVGAVLLGLLAPLQVNAASVAADNAFARFMATTVSAGQETISFGSNGTPVLTPSAGTISTGGGNIKVTRTGALGLPGSVQLPITATAKIPGSAASSIIKKALPLAGLAAAGPLGVALTSLAVEIGYNLVFDGTSSVSVTKPDPYACTASPCYYYDVSNYSNTVVGSNLPSLSAAKSYWETWVNDRRTPGTPPKTFVWWEDPANHWYACENGSCYYHGSIDRKSTRPPDTNASIPATQQELADAIANKTGWPDSSAIAEALNQSQRATGDTIPTEGPDVTGPASVTGPAEVTKTPIPNGQRETTKQTSYDCSYIDGATVMDGGTVSCTQKITTTDKDTVTDPQTQQTTTTTTQTSETTKPADTTAEKPKEPTDPCEANPDRVGCATLDTPTEDIPKATRDVSYTAEVLFGGGSCPANKTMTTHSGQTLTVWNWTQACDSITTYLRPIILILSAFGAMMILVPKAES